KGAVEPAESFFFVTEGDVNRSDDGSRDVSLLPSLKKLSKNILRLHFATHARVGDGKAAAREMGRLLGFGVKRDRFGEVPFLPIGSGKVRIQIKVIWIELQRPLTLTNCLVDLVVSQVGGGGNIADDGRDWI